MAGKREVIEAGEEVPLGNVGLTARLSALEERVARLENDKMFTANTQFEIWVDNKIRGFAYGPDLKKVVMPLSVGKTQDEARKIFFTERDKLVKERYPGQKTPMWI